MPRKPPPVYDDDWPHNLTIVVSLYAACFVLGFIAGFLVDTG